MVAAWDLHRRPCLPARRGVCLVEDLGCGHRRGGVVGGAAELHDLGRAAGSARHQHRGAPEPLGRHVGVVLPGVGARGSGRVEEPAVLGERPRHHRAPGRHREHVRIEATHSDVASRGQRAQQADGPAAVQIGRRRKQLHVGVALKACAGFVEPVDDHDSPVRHPGRGRVPASVAHVGLLGPALVPRVEGVDLVEAHEARRTRRRIRVREAQVAAEDHQPPVGGEGLSRAPEVGRLEHAVGGIAPQRRIDPLRECRWRDPTARPAPCSGCVGPGRRQLALGSCDRRTKSPCRSAASPRGLPSRESRTAHPNDQPGPAAPLAPPRPARSLDWRVQRAPTLQPAPHAASAHAQQHGRRPTPTARTRAAESHSLPRDPICHSDDQPMRAPQGSRGSEERRKAPPRTADRAMRATAKPAG